MRFTITGRTAYQAFIHIALIVLGIEVVVLAHQNRHLKGVNQTPEIVALKTGDSFSLSGIVALGSGWQIDSTSKQLICVFATKCPFCQKAIAGWKRLDSLRIAGRIAMIGISIDSTLETKRFVRENAIGWPIFVAGDPKEFKKMNHVAGVPLTALISGTGTVEQVWLGPLSPENITEVASAFSGNNTKHP
jgi:hypothetical protein